MRRTPFVVAAAISLVTVFAVPSVTAGGSTLVVDDDGAQCSSAGYTSIQAAIDAASAGDRVEVCAGTYDEHVDVDVRDLALVGPNNGTAGDGDRGPEAVVNGQLVVSASHVAVDGFTVSPPDPTTNAKGEALRVSGSPDDVLVTNNVVRDFDGSDLPDWEGADAIVVFGGDSSDPIEDVTITGNKVQDIQGKDVKGGATGISIQGNVQGATVTDNVVDDVGMQATGWAFGLVVRGTGNHDQVPSNVEFAENTVTDVLSNPSTSTVGVGVGSEADASAMTVTDNTVTGVELLVENKDIDHTLDVTANYWGDAHGPNTTENPLPTSAAGIGGAGDVSYTPWLDAPADQGGELTAPVENVDAGAYHLAIQDAIDAAGAGDTLQVLAGPFGESITVDKPLTLLGARDGESAPTRVSSAETVISGAHLQADDVTLDGFTVRADSCTGAGTGIETSASHSGYEIVNSIVTGFSRGAEVRSDGSSRTLVAANLFVDNDCGSNAAGLLSGFAPTGPMAGVVIRDNVFRGHTEGGNSVSLHLVNGGAHQDVQVRDNYMESSFVACDVTDLVVSGNRIEMDDPDSSTALFACGGVHGATITDNTLDGSQRGLWIAPGFFTSESNSGFSVLGNTITDNPTAGIQIADGRYTGALPVHGNDISGNGIGLDNDDADLTVDATRNWWGSPLGPTHPDNPASATGQTGDSIEGQADFRPWCVQPGCPALSQAP